MTTKRALALLLTLVMVFALAACTSSSPSPAAASTTAPAATTTAAADTDDTEDPAPAADKEFYSFEMFNTYSNYMGAQSGWFGKILKDELNIELIIVSTGGTEVAYQTRTAAGNLGDSIVQPKAKMIDCWKAGLLYDMKDLINDSPNLQKLSLAYESFAEMFDGNGIYAIPGRVSVQSIDTPAGRGNDLEVGAYIRYDWYLDLGSPEIVGIDGLLDVVAQIAAANPTTEKGDTTFGFSAFKDWDGDSVRAAREMLYMHGYTGGKGMVWMNEDGTKTVNLSDDGGLYYQYLQMFNKAYKMGILDVDSATQNWDSIKAKFDNGRVVFGWWPFLASSVFSRIDLNNRSPYAVVPVTGTVINTPSYNPYGLEGNAYAVGSGAKYPERIVEFYEWLASQRGILLTNSHVEGVTFEMVDGKPQLTDFGKDANNDKQAPESMGGGTWNDGSQKINYPLTHQDDPNELLNGYSSNSNLWPSTIESNKNEFNTAWIEKYGASNPIEYHKNNGMLVVTPGTDYSEPSEPSDITTIRAQIKELFQPAGWKMIYAETDAEFEQIWNEMKAQLDDFGFQELKAYDEGIVAGKAAAIARTLGK